MKYSKFIVALVIILNALFAAAVLYAFLKIGAEPTTLIISWFAFTTGELWILGTLSKQKIKNKQPDNCDEKLIEVVENLNAIIDERRKGDFSSSYYNSE
ncbi:MAG: hypothetical protein FWH20_00585 [Oscillospiraceae bacterium]|nr:hypothetical protein [Oscillospiraceae bacterium]